VKEQYNLVVNGSEYSVEAEASESLLEVLRERLSLTGSKIGCNEAECGSCTVVLDGLPMLSCVVLIADAQKKKIITIEGLATNEGPHPLQTAMVNYGGIQCGFCTPGVIMSAYALLEENPHPTNDEIRFALSGNICRCTGYGSIVEAVQSVVSAERST
jgi:carbon-monoxide dehydrogenase small subunit